MAFAAGDYLLFYGGAATAILAPWWTRESRLASRISGVAVAMLFALAHDAAHGSLAGSRAMNRLLATICFLPSWYPFTPWIRGHNHLHHGWTNVAECDYSWRPVSPAALPRRCRAGAARSSTCIDRGGACGCIRSSRSGGSTWRCRASSDRRYLDARHLAADRLLVAGQRRGARRGVLAGRRRSGRRSPEARRCRRPAIVARGRGRCPGGSST